MNVSLSQVILLICLVSTITISGCISEPRPYLSCNEFDSSAGNISEDEIRHYQSLSTRNQTLFKKAANRTRVQVNEPSTPSLNEKAIKYKNDTYDCDTFYLE